MRFRQRCVDCGRVFAPDMHITKCKCGGLIEFVYNLAEVRDFVDETREGIWRYWRLLPIEDPGNAELIEEGITPLYRSKNLGQLLGLSNLWIKDESKNPTATFKDREAGLSISRFRELGINFFVGLR